MAFRRCAKPTFLVWGAVAGSLAGATLTACSSMPTVSPIDAGPPPQPDGGPPPDVSDVNEPDAHSVVSVTMNANDPSGSGANTRETYLNVVNVKTSFGKLFSRPVDGDIVAQPLYAGGLTLPDGSKHNVVFVATVNDSVYAFDADDPKAAGPLWKTTVGTPSPMPNPYVGNHLDNVAGCASTPRFIDELGVAATPALDLATQTLYVVNVDVDTELPIANWSCIHANPKAADYCVTYSCTAPTFFYRLHALDMLTGKDKPGSPITVSASVPGSGGGSTSGTLPFDNMRSFARPGLLLANGNVYFAFSGYSDLNVYHGWIFAYDTATLKQVGAYCDTPNGVQGGIWMSGRSILADAAGNIYFTTGNGTFTAGSGGEDYGDSVMKMNANLSRVIDYFSPFLSDYESNNLLEFGDNDLGSAGATMIPNTTMILASGKLGFGYLLDTGNLGKFNATGDDVVQKIRLTWPTTATSCEPNYRPAYVYSTPVAWNGEDATGNVATHVYVWGMSDDLREYELDKNGKFSSQGVCFCTPVVPLTINGNSFQVDVPDPPCGVVHSQGAERAGFGGGALAVSSNGTQGGTGILWASHAVSGDPNAGSSPGVLEAYDATYVTSPIWSSATNAVRDGLGNWAKFTPPTVANGKVYMATFSGELAVYGLLASP